MTVAEYIEKLRLLPQGAQCCIWNEEWGQYEFSTGPEITQVGFRILGGSPATPAIIEDWYGDERQSGPVEVVKL